MQTTLTALFLSISLFVNANDSLLFKITVLNLSQAGKYEELMRDAIDILNKTINTEQFKDSVLSYNFDWDNLAVGGRGKMLNSEVFDTLFPREYTHSTNLFIKRKGARYIKFWASSTIGVTNLNVNKTVSFRKYFKVSDSAYRCSVIRYAVHIAHEYCHQRGFSDKEEGGSTYRNVVPYAVGDIVCSLLSTSLNQNCNCKF